MLEEFSVNGMFAGGAFYPIAPYWNDPKSIKAQKDPL
jgi:hypothetical protein